MPGLHAKKPQCSESSVAFQIFVFPKLSDNTFDFTFFFYRAEHQWDIHVFLWWCRLVLFPFVIACDTAQGRQGLVPSAGAQGAVIKVELLQDFAM